MTGIRKYPRTRHILDSRLQPGDDDFPAVHWKHIRIGNSIESNLRNVRHRLIRAKGLAHGIA